MTTSPKSKKAPGADACLLARPLRTAAVVGLVCLVFASVLSGGGSAEEPGAVRKVLSRSIETDLEAARAAAEGNRGEAIHFEWRLGGFLGTLAGLFLPNRGDSLLTFVPTERGRLEIQILITAPRREGEYFLYGAEIDDRGDTASVWSSYRFRGSDKAREQDIAESGVIDFASAIYHLRRDPPEQTLEMRIWDDGDFHPVEVEPLGPVRRKLGRRRVELRGYEIRGVKVDGKRSFDDKYFLYFTSDESATLAQIVAKRGFVKLQLSRVG